VTVGNLSLSLLSGGVRADQLSIADDSKFSNAPFIKAKSLKVGVELMPLIFSKQLNVTEVVIDEPEIALLRNQAGVWNFSSLGNSAEKKTPEKSTSASNLNVGKLDLTDGKISLEQFPPGVADCVRQGRHLDAKFQHGQRISGNGIDAPPVAEREIDGKSAPSIRKTSRPLPRRS
jgi:hypothetical protein